MVKHIARTFVILLLLSVAGAVAALMWIRQDARSLEWARPSITSALNPENAPYTVNYADASIDWRDWSQFGLLQVKNVTLSARDGTVFASLPAVYISFNPIGMLTGQHRINTILLYKPKLVLARDADKILRLGVESDQAAIPVAHLLAFVSDGSSEPMKLGGALPFHRLIVDRASLSVTDAVTNTSFTSTRATFRLTRSGSHLDASIGLPFLYNKQAGNLDATLRSFALNDTHVLNASLDHIPVQLACIVTTCSDGMDANGLLSGKLSVAFDDEMTPTALDVNLNANNGVFTAPKIFAEPLVIKRGLIQLKASQSMHLVNLSRLSLVAEDTAFEVTGSGRRDDAGWHVDAQARATKPLALPKLYKYWPLPLAPASREWVIGSMLAGRGEQLYLNLKLAPADFTAHTISDGAVDAGLLARDITAEYLPGFPPMKHIDATVHFTGSTATIDANTGALLTGTTLKHAAVVFPDLNKPGTPMEVVTSVHAPATDAATLLSLKYFSFDDALKLDPATIKGSVDALLNLKFDAFSHEAEPNKPRKKDEIDFTNVIYDVTTDLHDIAQDKFAGKINVVGVNGLLKANNAGMNFDGSLLFSGATALAMKVNQTSGEDVSITASGTLGRAQMIEFGATDGDYFGEGTAKVNAQLLAQKNGVVIKNADADFTDMALAIPELSWIKKRGVAGHASLASDATSGGAEQRYTGKINADDLKIPDLLLTLDANQQLKSLSVPSVVSARNRFAASYRARADGFDVSLTGRRLDMANSFAKNDGGLLKDFPGIALTLDLGELVLAEDAPLSNVKGNLLCNAQRCDSATIHATIGKSNVNASIASNDGGRHLLLTASDAGDFLRAVNFTDRMYRGALEIKGNYDDSKQPPVFLGNVNIYDFTLKNSAILGRIFSIGSLTGLANALTGSGIAFDKMVADITHQAGVIDIAKGKANGNAMGITVSGSIDTNAAKLNLKGVVVPAYAINSLIGKIPLIGAIAGGDGEGLIAFNYKVGGTYNEPDVSVNALSGLTPGFLRGIFGIFDSKEKKPAAPVSKPEVKENPAPIETP